MRYLTHSIMNAILLTVVCWISVPEVAHAYLDSGTLSYVIQMIIAGAIGMIFTIKMTWKRVKSYFNDLFLKRKI